MGGEFGLIDIEQQRFAATPECVQTLRVVHDRRQIRSRSRNLASRRGAPGNRIGIGFSALPEFPAWHQRILSVSVAPIVAYADNAQAEY